MHRKTLATLALAGLLGTISPASAATSSTAVSTSIIGYTYRWPGAPEGLSGFMFKIAAMPTGINYFYIKERDPSYFQIQSLVERSIATDRGLKVTYLSVGGGLGAVQTVEIF